MITSFLLLQATRIFLTSFHLLSALGLIIGHFILDISSFSLLCCCASYLRGWCEAERRTVTNEHLNYEPVSSVLYTVSSSLPAQRTPRVGVQDGNYNKQHDRLSLMPSSGQQYESFLSVIIFKYRFVKYLLLLRTSE